MTPDDDRRMSAANSGGEDRIIVLMELLSTRLGGLEQTVTDLRGTVDKVGATVVTVDTAIATYSAGVDRIVQSRVRSAVVYAVSALVVLVAVSSFVVWQIGRDTIAQQVVLAMAQARACAEAIETRSILLDAYIGRRDAVAAGATGSTGANQVAEVARLDAIIVSLSAATCDGAFVVPPASSLTDISDQLDELEELQRRDLSGEDELLEDDAASPRPAPVSPAAPPATGTPQGEPAVNPSPSPSRDPSPGPGGGDTPPPTTEPDDPGPSPTPDVCILGACVDLPGGR